MIRPRTSYNPLASLDEALSNHIASQLEPIVRRLDRMETQLAALLSAVQADLRTGSRAETWLDVRTVCERTGLGLTKVHNLIGSGELVSTKVGRRRLVAASSIDGLMRGTASHSSEVNAAGIA